MTPAAILTITDGVKVAVPDEPNLITPYVLREQQDWFEDEIKFLRHLLQPGHKVIDIGANYGVYTLSMAKTVGSSGHVWAFEPASSTANLLDEGIAANGFTQVTLERSALSSASGTAQLSLNINSEMNALVRNQSSAGTSETVPLVTLDNSMETYGWRDIEFVKIDAEGEEANILKGGKRFFSKLSPLIQYEVKGAGNKMHLELVKAFALLGYHSYRLVPGLNMLIPFEAKVAPDEFLINLFCCKPDQAARLSERGALIDSAAWNKGKEQIKHFLKNADTRQAYSWQHVLEKLPYATLLTQQWKRMMDAGNSGDVDDALSLYALSRDVAASPAERFCALEAGFRRLKILCERYPSHMRLASLARIAREYGARSIAVNALGKLLGNTTFQNKPMDLNEPFLAPGMRFDTVPPGASLDNWVLAAVLEELELLVHYSSIYTGASARQRLETIHYLGYGSEEMGRRLSLLQQRFAA